jgi:hypothetical protein
MTMQRRLVPLVALATFTGWADGELRFSRALGSHMVLQQAPARANIWGFDAPAGAEVIITLRAMDGGSGRLVGTANATADQNGNFAALLPPQSPGPRSSSPTAHTIRAAVVSGRKTVAAVEMVDVLFGELWMCGGYVRLLVSFAFCMAAQMLTRAWMVCKSADRAICNLASAMLATPLRKSPRRRTFHTSGSSPPHATTTRPRRHHRSKTLTCPLSSRGLSPRLRPLVARGAQTSALYAGSQGVIFTLTPAAQWVYCP